MWCVAELDDEYIAKMEDVLETYEKSYDPAEPVVSAWEIAGTETKVAPIPSAMARTPIRPTWELQPAYRRGGPG